MRYAISVLQPKGNWALRSFDGEFECPSLDVFLEKVKDITKRLDTFNDTPCVVECPKNLNDPVKVVYQP